MSVRMTTAGQAIPGRLPPLLSSFWLTGLMVIVAMALFLVEPLAQWAAWHRSLPLGPQLWTSHLAHWSFQHLFWDLLTFAILAGVLEVAGRGLLIRVLLVAPPVILLCVWVFEDHLVYRGLSGIDCALYTALMIAALRKGWIGPWLAVIAIILFVGKIAFEIITGATVFVSDLPQGISGVPWAHLAGAATGLTLGILPWVSRNFKKLDNNGSGKYFSEWHAEYVKKNACS